MAPILFDPSAIDTVIFDFDGTLARLNIGFEQMRRDVASLIDRWGVDPRSLQNRFVLEMIAEVDPAWKKFRRPCSFVHAGSLSNHRRD